MSQTTLDATQVLKEVYDAINDGLRVNVVDTVSSLTALDSVGAYFIVGTSIQGNAGSFFEVTPSLSKLVQRIQIYDTTGVFVGVYVGADGLETLEFITGPGTDQAIDVEIPAGSRISLRAMEATSPVAGSYAINLLG